MTKTAGALAQNVIGELKSEVDVWERAVLDRKPDSIHQLRVRLRRLRSVVTLMRDVYGPVAAEALDAELKWAAGILGQARDLEVLYARFRDVDGGLDTSALLRRLQWRYDSAHARSLAMLRSERYIVLRSAIDVLHHDGPSTEHADDSSKSTLNRGLRRAQRKVADAATAVKHTPGDDEAMHRLRKKLKRLRYSLDAAPKLTKSQRTLRAKTKRAQKLLGEFQDSVVAQHALTELVDRARDAGEDTYVYGVLVAREAQQQLTVRADIKPVIAALRH